jgi:hypothetical protein
MQVTGSPFAIDFETTCPLQYRSFSDKFAKVPQTVPYRRAPIGCCFLLGGVLQRFAGGPFIPDNWLLT